MSGSTFGAQLYEQFVANGERSRFAYADVQILKKITPAEELRILCSQISGETFSDDTSSIEMLEACAAPDHDQSVAEAAGSLISVASAGESALLAMVLMPVLLLGFLVGRILNATGLNIERFVQLYSGKLIALAVASFMIGIALLAGLKTGWPIWIGNFSGLCAGLAIAKPRMFDFSVAFLLAILIPAALFTAQIPFLEHPDPIPSITSVICLGTGYGMCRSFTEIFAKRPGRKLKHGSIVLSPRIQACKSAGRLDDAQSNSEGTSPPGTR